MDLQRDMFAMPVADKRAPQSDAPSRSKSGPAPASLTDDEIVRKLEGSGQYRILRKLIPRQLSTIRRAEFERIGAIFDMETTGLN